MSDAPPIPDRLVTQDLFPASPQLVTRRSRRAQRQDTVDAYAPPEHAEPILFPALLGSGPAPTVTIEHGIPEDAFGEPGDVGEPSDLDEAGEPGADRAGDDTAGDGRSGTRHPVPAFLVERRGLLLAGLTGLTATAAAGSVLLKSSDATTPGTTGAISGKGTAGASSKAVPTPQPVATKKAGFVLPRNLDPDLLISRTTYGRTATLERQVHESTPTKWLAAQLKPSTVADPAGASISARYPRLGWSVQKVRASIHDGDWAVMQDLKDAHLARACWSSRQLLEVMVDFWSNHLNVTVPSDGVWDSRHRYDADVIRANALGSFEKMLLASAFHPSMLIYLNNAESTKDAPNENYGRELLELHTVGVNGGYTENDVKKGALLLTGWTVMEGKASYDRTRHHVGKLKILGFSTANSTSAGGKTAQQHYLSYLAHHPKTAQNIAYKLAQRFVSDAPPAALVKRLAKVYLKSKTETAPVLRALFTSPEFAASAGEKVRRPMEVMAASVRVLGIRPGKDSKGINDLGWMLNGMGHWPLGWPQPNGYGDVAADWQSPSSALAQFNSAASLVHGWWPDKLDNPTATKLLSSAPRNREAVIDAVGRKLFGRKPTSKEHSAARSLLAGTSLPSTFAKGTYQQQETIALVATLFLQSPAHLTR